VRYGASTNGREREETERTTRTRSSPATRRAAQKRRGWLGGDGTDDERRRPWLEGNLDSGQLRAYRHDSFSEDGADDETELPAQFDLLGEAQDGGISRRPPARVRLVCGEEENEARRRNGRHRRGGGLRPRPYACQGTGAAGRGRGIVARIDRRGARSRQWRELDDDPENLQRTPWRFPVYHKEVLLTYLKTVFKFQNAYRELFGPQIKF
jgi:hypothetical protein